MKHQAPESPDITGDGRMTEANRGDETALEALARAYDREDASQRGEPDPWEDGAEDQTWRAERLACAKAAMVAISTPIAAGSGEAQPVAWLRQKDIDDLAKMGGGATSKQIANTSFGAWTVPVFASPPLPDTEEKRS